MTSLYPSPFLRQALLADAVTSGACALLMVSAAGILESVLGIPASLLRGAGLALVPFVTALVFLAMRDTIPRAAAWAVIALNGLWVADSFLILLSGWIDPTRAGKAFIVAQALVVAMYAELQFVGLRRSRPATVS